MLKIIYFARLAVFYFVYIAFNLVNVFGNCEKSKTILVFRSAALGDFIMSIPALILLREQNPECHIVLLTLKTANKDQQIKVCRYADCKEDLPWLQLLPTGTVNEVFLVSDLSLRGIFRLRKNVSLLKPNKSILLLEQGAHFYGVVKKIVWLRILGIKGAIYGWRDGTSVEWLREQQYAGGGYMHHVLGLIRSLLENPSTFNLETISVRCLHQIPHGVEKKIDSLWKTYSLNTNVIAIVPGALQKHKQWPREKFRALCELLYHKYNVSIIITGIKGDEYLGEYIKQDDTLPIINLIGKTNILELAALYSRCKAVIGNDGGSMHLADLVGVPVISIVPGLEYPDSIEPWNSIKYSIRHKEACSPCYSFEKCPRGDNKCMQNISVKDVAGMYSNVLQDLESGICSKNNVRSFKIIRKGHKISFSEIERAIREQ